MEGKEKEEEEKKEKSNFQKHGVKLVLKNCKKYAQIQRKLLEKPVNIMD